MLGRGQPPPLLPTDVCTPREYQTISEDITWGTGRSKGTGEKKGRGGEEDEGGGRKE